MAKPGRPLLGSTPLTQTEKNRRHRAKKKRLAAEPNARGHEWGTPIAIIEAVREVFGGPIECDPATHAAAQERVRARTYYTAEDDGLDPKRQWRGKVFLNPPYQRGLIDRFVKKLLVEYVTHHTTEAIVLVNAQTDTFWFHDLMAAASACCFPTGRVRFLNSDGKPGMPQVGQAIFYIGPNTTRFRAVFGGWDLTAPSEPHQRARDGERVEREHTEPNVIGFAKRNARQTNGAEY